MAKMCIGVLSDTHGNRRAFERALEAMGAVDLLLHAGDFANDAIVMGNMYGIPVQTVAGNCDFFGTAEEAKLFEIAGHTILLVHGHRQHVKSGLEKLYEAGCANAPIGWYAPLFQTIWLPLLYQKNHSSLLQSVPESHTYFP